MTPLSAVEREREREQAVGRSQADPHALVVVKAYNIHVSASYRLQQCHKNANSTAEDTLRL